VSAVISGTILLGHSPISGRYYSFSSYCDCNAQTIIHICGEYATEYCISFNASKSKYLAVLPANRRELNNHLSDCCFSVNGKPIELVQSYQHLVHTITSQLNDVSDITAKQNAFIGHTKTTCAVFSGS